MKGKEKRKQLVKDKHGAEVPGKTDWAPLSHLGIGVDKLANQNEREREFAYSLAHACIVRPVFGTTSS